MIFGLAAALGWGFADFFGAVSGRRIGALGAVMAGQFVSALIMTALLLAGEESLAPLAENVDLLVLNGIFSAFAYATHYRALELGPVAVVSPIGAGYAIVAVALSMLIAGERPGTVALIGAAVSIAGVALVSTDLRKLRDGIRTHLPGLWWSIAAAIGFGVAAFLLARISQRAGWIPGLWGSRVAQVAFYVPLIGVFRRELARVRPNVGLLIAVLAGLADVVGVIAYSIGSTRELISIVVAASAVFPLIAVTLSLLVFDERIVPNQVTGIVLVIGGLLLLGLG